MSFTIQKAQMIHQTEHEKAEWLRMAVAAYAAGRNDIGNKYSAAARTKPGSEMRLWEFDSLMADYRSWLVFGEFRRG